jgi:hypothetical protein
MATIYALLRPDVPVITHIEKETIMGNSENKTYHYYLGLDVLSYMSCMYRINYSFKGRDYSIICDNESYHEAIHYIKSVDTVVEKNNVFKVYDRNGDDVTYDFLCFAGPLGDFYKNTDFHSKPEFFSESDIFVISASFNIKKHQVNSYITSDISRRRMSR